MKIIEHIKLFDLKIDPAKVHEFRAKKENSSKVMSQATLYTSTSTEKN